MKTCLTMPRLTAGRKGASEGEQVGSTVCTAVTKLEASRLSGCVVDAQSLV